VDAFVEGKVMLAIVPEICIDCGVCENECPAGAILPDKLVEPRWVELNARMSRLWPKITSRGRPFGDADAMSGVPDKYEQHFSADPGVGD
jgi:ferredoxin